MTGEPTAYEVAVANGFVGTEEEFCEMAKQPSTYSPLVINDTDYHYQRTPIQLPEVWFWGALLAVTIYLGVCYGLY
jgi:hypothetical protein